jgi:hypothetical protein
VKTRTLAAALALLALIVMVGPAAAYSGPGGFESRVRCYNKTIGGGPTSPYWEWQLRSILVTGPEVFGLRDGQTVGWRFIVDRRTSDGDWVRRYRSPIQKAIASTSKRVAFSSMDVKVDLPPFAYETSYRVAVKVIWYKPDGTVKRAEKSGVQTYRIWIDGQFRWKEGACAGQAGYAT